MARGINKVIAIGNLGADPETRYLPSGVAVANFSIAVTEGWKDKQTGEQKTHTEWINCEVWGKQAENCAQFLKKGSQCYIDGKLRTEQWDDSEGQKRYRTKIRVDNVQFLGSPSGDKRPSAPADRTQPPEQDFDDDIPF